MHKADKYKLKAEMPGFYSVYSYLVGPRRELMKNKFLSIITQIYRQEEVWDFPRQSCS